VRILEAGEPLPAATERARREVLNHLKGLRFIERRAKKPRITQEDILALHRIIGAGVMDQGEAGRYRSIAVRVGRHSPPPPADVSGLMSELLTWWNGPSRAWSPVISSAVLHYRFEDIHPFADGNGRTGRALALWELYRRGFDTQHIFSVDEYFWEDRPSYYEALDAVRRQAGDLTGWLEYTAEGLKRTLDTTWRRLPSMSAERSAEWLTLRPKQHELLRLLQERKSLAPREIWSALKISRQGAMDLLNPLLRAGAVRRTGTRKSGGYVLA